MFDSGEHNLHQHTHTHARTHAHTCTHTPWRDHLHGALTHSTIRSLEKVEYWFPASQADYTISVIAKIQVLFPTWGRRVLDPLCVQMKSGVNLQVSGLISNPSEPNQINAKDTCFTHTGMVLRVWSWKAHWSHSDTLFCWQILTWYLILTRLTWSGPLV